MFSPKVRVSFAIFLRFSRSLRAVEVESMLNDEVVGEKDSEDSMVVMESIRLSMFFLCWD